MKILILIIAFQIIIQMVCGIFEVVDFDYNKTTLLMLTLNMLLIIDVGIKK